MSFPAKPSGGEAAVPLRAWMPALGASVPARPGGAWNGGSARDRVGFGHVRELLKRDPSVLSAHTTRLRAAVRPDIRIGRGLKMASAMRAVIARSRQRATRSKHRAKRRWHLASILRGAERRAQHGELRRTRDLGVCRLRAEHVQIQIGVLLALHRPASHYWGSASASTLASPNSFVAVFNAVADKVCVANTASRFMGLEIDT